MFLTDDKGQSFIFEYDRFSDKYSIKKYQLGSDRNLFNTALR